MNTCSPKRHRRAAFTLAEMMVVVVILGLLATLVVPNALGHYNDAQRGKIKADLCALESALEHYALNNSGKYPDTLELLVMADVNGETYLRQTKLPRDPWGNEYHYEPPRAGQSRPRLYSLGKDGVQGGEGMDRDVDVESVRNGDGK
jgi:general secretion pathway protein G